MVAWRRYCYDPWKRGKGEKNHDEYTHARTGTHTHTLPNFVCCFTGTTHPTSLGKHLKMTYLSSFGPLRIRKEATVHTVSYPDLIPGLGTVHMV